MNTQYSWLCMCQLNNYKSHTLYTVITVNCPLKQVSSWLSKWPEVTLTGWNWKQQTAIMWETRDLKVIWTVAAAICSGSRFRSASVWQPGPADHLLSVHSGSLWGPCFDVLQEDKYLWITHAFFQLPLCSGWEQKLQWSLTAATTAGLPKVERQPSGH